MLIGIMMILCSEVFFFAIVIDNHRTGEADMNRAHPSVVEKRRSFGWPGVRQPSKGSQGPLPPGKQLYVDVGESAAFT